MEPTTKKESPPSLAHSTLTVYRPQFSYERALARGAIVDITAWCGQVLARAEVTVRVAVTARLWKRLVRTCARMTSSQTAGVQNRDVVRLAARALEQAQRAGMNAANFHVRLPNESDEQTLRVESQELDESTTEVIIGFPEELASL